MKKPKDKEERWRKIHWQWADNGRGFDVNKWNGSKVVQVAEMRRRGIQEPELTRILRQRMMEGLNYQLALLYPDMAPFDPTSSGIRYTEGCGPIRRLA